MGKHQNESAVRKIEKRLSGKERPQGVDFVVNGNAYEFAENKQDIRDSIGQLNRSRVRGLKKLIVPNNLGKFAREVTKGTGIGIENISGRILKKSRSR